MSEQMTETVAHDEQLADLFQADEEKLLHEIKYQRQRNTNLEGFKRMFFALKAELDSTRASTGQDNNTPPFNTDPHDSTARTNQLEQDLKGANEMAMLSMVTIGEYGSVMSFCKTTVTAESYDDLVELIYECMTAYGLSVTIQLNGVDGASLHCQDEQYKDEDIKLLDELKDSGRIIEQENIVAFNHKYINLCVRNFPFDDHEKCGRLKDYLAIIASVADSAIKTLDADVKLARQYQNLQTILKAVPQMIEKIQSGINKQNNKALDIQQDFVSNMAGMIKKQGMGEKCNTLLQTLASSHQEAFQKTFSQSVNLTDNLVQMIKQLEHTYVDNESDVDIRSEIELPGTNNEDRNKQNESPLDF